MSETGCSKLERASQGIYIAMLTLVPNTIFIKFYLDVGIQFKHAFLPSEGFAEASSLRHEISDSGIQAIYLFRQQSST